MLFVSFKLQCCAVKSVVLTLIAIIVVRSGSCVWVLMYYSEVLRSGINGKIEKEGNNEVITTEALTCHDEFESF